MAETRRVYTWTIDFDDPLMPAELGSQVMDVAQRWCAMVSGLSNPHIGGTMFGLLQVSVTVQARDRWAVHRKAMRFAAAMAASCRTTLTQLGQPTPEKLPPHTNRGRYRWLVA